MRVPPNPLFCVEYEKNDQRVQVFSSKNTCGRTIHDEQGPSIGGTGYHGEDQQVSHGGWLLHQLLELQATYIEQNIERVVSNLQGVGGASSTPRCLFA